MRDYGKVYSTVWSSPTIAGLSTNAKLLAVYLMTCQHGTIAGVFRLPDGYVAEDLQWSLETVSEGFRELFAKGFANRCETTKWVWITKHLEWNPPENPNQRKAAAKMAAAVPDECAWKRDFMRVCGESLGLDAPTEQEPLRNPSQTVPEPVTVTVAVAVDNPPNPPRGGKPGPVELKSWLASVKAAGEKPIPDGDPVFAYAEEIGLPHEYLHLAWLEFRARYTDAGDRGKKRYSDWRAVFRKAVRTNWLRLWWAEKDGTWTLTTAGMQAKRVHFKEAA